MVTKRYYKQPTTTRQGEKSNLPLEDWKAITHLKTDVPPWCYKWVVGSLDGMVSGYRAPSGNYHNFANIRQNERKEAKVVILSSPSFDVSCP